jgi:2-polyprenyl-3-methyl-5-hydroxy-6-metoxy-1,4-benzoquinol methylase
MEPEMYSAAIPFSVEPPDRPASTVPSTDEWLELTKCLGCGTSDRTFVCKWNKAMLREEHPPDDSAVYKYALCHGCGIVYASRRPVGGRLRALMDDFPDTIGRDPAKAEANLVVNPYPLSESDREHYRKLIAGGVFVSDDERRAHLLQVVRGTVNRRQRTEGERFWYAIYKDQVENATHVEILGSLLDLNGARVLEVRSKLGAIAQGLRRHHGASVKAMPIFESQRFIVEELYGIECSDVIDYDMFTIPFEDVFDLIVCNHMLTHIVRTDRFFDELRAHLRPGGRLYLYNEMDENHIFSGGRSFVNSLNPVHLQTFDRASLMRLLNANGFEVTFIKHRHGTLVCLATFTDRRQLTSTDDAERNRRIAAYARSRARTILRAPDRLRTRFADEWAGAVEDAVSSGIARFDAEGALHLLKDTLETPD